MSSNKKASGPKNGTKPALIPKLRFPEFRGTEGWSEGRLANIATVLQGYGFPERHQGQTRGDFPFYKVSDISRSLSAGRVFIEESANYINEGLLKELRAKLIPEGTTIFAKIGEAIRSNKRAITTVPCLIDNNAAGVKGIKGKATDFFIYLLMERVSLIDHAGGVVPAVNKSAIEEIIVKFPKPAEQQKIAECLSSVDEVIAAQARRVEALKTQKNGLMQKLFPRQGETRPQLRFPEFRKDGEWKLMPLSKLITSLDAGVSVNSGDRPAKSNEVGVLKTSAVTNGLFEPDENKVVFDDLEIGRVKEPVQADTIIISRMNTPALVGANAYVEAPLENIFLPDRLWAAKAKPGTSMRFVAFILGSGKGRAALSKLAKGSSGSMKNITKPDVLAFLIMAPSLAEQRRIASCLSSLDALITAENQKLGALKRHKLGLMQQLFPPPEEVKA